MYTGWHWGQNGSPHFFQAFVYSTDKLQHLPLTKRFTLLLPASWTPWGEAWIREAIPNFQQYPSSAWVPQQSSQIPPFPPEKTQTESPHYNCALPPEQLAGVWPTSIFNIVIWEAVFFILKDCDLSSHGCLPLYVLAVGSNPRVLHHGFNFHNQQESLTISILFSWLGSFEIFIFKFFIYFYLLIL